MDNEALKVHDSVRSTVGGPHPIVAVAIIMGMTLGGMACLALLWMLVF